MNLVLSIVYTPSSFYVYLSVTRLLRPVYVNILCLPPPLGGGERVLRRFPRRYRFLFILLDYITRVSRFIGFIW